MYVCVYVYRHLGRKTAHEAQYLHISVMRRSSIGMEIEGSIHSPGSIKLLSGRSSGSSGIGIGGNDAIEDFWGWYCCLETPLERLTSDVLIVIEISSSAGGGSGGMKGDGRRSDDNNSNRDDGNHSSNGNRGDGGRDGDCWGIYALDKSSIVSGSTSISLHSYPIIFGYSSHDVVDNNIATTSPLKTKKNSSDYTLHFDVLLTKKNPEFTLQQIMRDS